MLEIIVSILILTGAIFNLIGSIGLVKLPDFYKTSCTNKGYNFGSWIYFISIFIYFNFKTDTLSLHEILITMFLIYNSTNRCSLNGKISYCIKRKMKRKENNKFDLEAQK